MDAMGRKSQTPLNTGCSMWKTPRKETCGLFFVEVFHGWRSHAITDLIYDRRELLIPADVGQRSSAWANRVFGH